MWYDALLASAGSTSSTPTLFVDGVTLTKSDDNSNTCLKSTLTFNGTLAALTALNGVVLNCAAQQSPAAHATITIPGIKIFCQHYTLNYTVHAYYAGMCKQIYHIC